MSNTPSETPGARAAVWRPLEALDRRVAGVLVEKAKTTPDAYPMSLSALRAGCNQKNNRDPVMDVALEDIEESLERLKAAGAATEVQAGGRVSRYRHLMYEWLGVDKVELAVMAELLLRGAQTEGELRGRAARMEPIADLAALRPVLASLAAKGLVVSLTPEGRGHVLTHALYPPRELERVRADTPSNQVASSDSAAPMATSAPRPAASQSAAQHEVPLQRAVEELRRELADLRADLTQLRNDFEQLTS